MDLHGLPRCGRAEQGLQVFPARALEAGCGLVRVEGHEGGSAWQGF